MSQLLEGLNTEQTEAVTHVSGPLMIIAGAGTGKTTVITRRIAWLIEQGYAKPENILALTFTEKAAAEMEERVDLLLPYGYVDLCVSTFHAFCERLLRDYGTDIGLSRDFTVLDELDAWLLARQEFDRFELNYYRPLGNPTKYLKTLLQHFSRAKDEMITPEAYLAHVESCRADLDTLQAGEEATVEIARTEELARAYHTYQQILLEHDALDFGDLVAYALRLLSARPSVLSVVRKRFSHILVDEFQDTNGAQYELVKRLAFPVNQLTVVGDDDQSIYKFRGASLANILRFEEDFPDCKRVVLSKNYRSGQLILDHAYRFIQKNNPNRLEGKIRPDGLQLTKQLVSERSDAGHVEHIHFDTFEQEARGVADKICALREEYPDANWNDFGVLVRANSAASDFIQVFDRVGIPYQFMALRGLYAKGIILDLQAFLQVVDNPYHSPSFYRVLSHPMLGISSHAFVTLVHEANKKGKTLYEICRTVRLVPGVEESVAQTIESLLSLFDRLAQKAKTATASEIMVYVAKESGLVTYVNTLPEGKKRDDFRFLHQFYERVKRFDARSDQHDLHHFLTEFQHERDAGEEGSLAMDVEAGPDVVRIMTVHGSKGLEFRFVFVVNVVDRRFPASERQEAIELPNTLISQQVPEGDIHLEEERRLFYVAMTRAKDALFFTSADDYGGARKKKPSRFLFELDLLQNTSSEKIDGAETLFSSSSSPNTPSNEERYALPKQISFTQIKAFQTCPLQYKFAHLLRIPVFQTWTQSYGKTMHQTLQQWFQLWIEHQTKTQQDLFGSSTERSSVSKLPATLEELLQAFEENWIDDWYPNDRERETYRIKGVQCLKDYFAVLSIQPPKPFLLEQSFTLKIGSITIKGRIDRMDRIEGGIEIVDYKTGTPKQKLETEDKQQLLLYQMAVQDVFGLIPKKLTYHYLEDHSEVSFLGKEKELEKLREQIMEQAEQMKTSLFTATPGFHCRFCDFRDICEFREEL